MSSSAEFVKDLPCHNKNNFTQFSASSSKRPTIYQQTNDTPSEQVIVPEKTHILLRYLHKQWEKKQNSKKRENGNPRTDAPAKRIRLDEDC